MPDITKCEGFDCKNKSKCYRYTSIPSMYQSYFTSTPMNDDGTCDYFIKTKTYGNKKEKEEVQKAPVQISKIKKKDNKD